jgi:CDP-diglyceride synthetase
LGAILLPTILINGIFWTLGQLSDGWLAIKMPFLDYLLLGFMVSALAILGDLIESFIKRCANSKDAGTTLGSHGGFLDRIDSLLLSFPFLYWYCIEFMSYTHSPNYHFDNVHVF